MGVMNLNISRWLAVYESGNRAVKKVNIGHGKSLVQVFADKALLQNMLSWM